MCEMLQQADGGGAAPREEEPPWEVVAGELRAMCSPVCPWGRALGIPTDRWTGPCPHPFRLAQWGRAAQLGESQDAPRSPRWPSPGTTASQELTNHTSSLGSPSAAALTPFLWVNHYPTGALFLAEFLLAQFFWLLIISDFLNCSKNRTKKSVCWLHHL